MLLNNLVLLQAQQLWTLPIHISSPEAASVTLIICPVTDRFKTNLLKNEGSYTAFSLLYYIHYHKLSAFASYHVFSTSIVKYLTELMTDHIMFNSYISAGGETEFTFTNKTANSPNHHDKYTPPNNYLHPCSPLSNLGLLHI